MYITAKTEGFCSFPDGSGGRYIGKIPGGPVVDVRGGNTETRTIGDRSMVTVAIRCDHEIEAAALRGSKSPIFSTRDEAWAWAEAQEQ